MTAAIYNFGGGSRVSLFNSNRLVNEKYFATEKKAKNYCQKYGYKISETVSEYLDCAIRYEQ